MIRAVLFDFDGTIADTIPAITEGVNRTMKALGYPLHTEAEVRSFINHGPRKLIAGAIAPITSDEAEIDRALEIYEGCYGEVFDRTRVPYPGVAELIASLRQKGIKIGVLSNKENRLVKILAENVLQKGTFDAVQGTEEGLPTKPNPTMTFCVAKALGVDPSECVMVGDSDVDIKTAHNAGMKAVSVTWGYRDADFLRANGAELLANDAKELESILQALTEKR